MNKIHSLISNKGADRIYLILLFAILLVGVFLRFDNAFIRYSLGDESIYSAVVANVSAKTLDFPLTGPFSSVGPFTVGPWYWYNLIIFQILVPTLYSPWIIMGILSTLTIIVYYKIGEKLIDKRLGLLMAFFAMLSPSHISSAFGLTNPNMMHFYIALTFYFFIVSLSKKTSRWNYFLFGVSLAIPANMHFQMLTLFSLPFIGAIFKKEDRLRFLLLSFLGIFIIFLPLLIFNFQYHWHTLINFIDYAILNKKNINIPYRWLFYIRDFWPQLFQEVIGTPLVVSTVLFAFTVVTTAYFGLKRKLPIACYPLLVAFFLVFFYLRYYSREKSMGYLHFLHPFLFIFLATDIYLLIKNLKYRDIVLTVLVIIFTFFIVPYDISRATPDPINVGAKKRIAEIEAKYPGNYALFKCKDDNSEPYMSYVSSTMFLLGKAGKLTNPTVKLAFVSDKACAHLQKGESSPKHSGDVINVSSRSGKNLAKLGFEEVNFQKKYNETVRWWLDEKP